MDYDLTATLTAAEIFAAGHAASAPDGAKPVWTAEAALFQRLTTIARDHHAAVAKHARRGGILPPDGDGLLAHVNTVGVRRDATKATLDLSTPFMFQHPAGAVAASICGAPTVELRIDSTGGNFLWTLELGVALRASGATITATVTDKAWSAAAFLVQFAHHRRMAESGSMMVHAANVATVTNAAGLRMLAEHLELSDASMRTLFVARSQQPEATIREWLSRDTYFTAAEALAAGLVDEIISADS